MDIKEQIAEFIFDPYNLYSGTWEEIKKRQPKKSKECLDMAEEILTFSEIKEALSLLELSNIADQLFKGREISLKELMKLYIDGKLVKLSDNQGFPLQKDAPDDWKRVETL